MQTSPAVGDGLCVRNNHGPSSSSDERTKTYRGLLGSNRIRQLGSEIERVNIDANTNHVEEDLQASRSTASHTSTVAGLYGKEARSLCRAATCADGVTTLAAKCDGMGKCEEPKTQKCEPFACGEGRCLERCSVDADCTDGYRCAAGKCVTGAYCSDNRTVKNAGAPDIDCAPYLCEGDRCKTSCGSSTDCVGGFLCDNGTCVTPPSAIATEDSGGCTYGTRASHAGWLCALVLALGLARRRTSLR